MQQAIMYKIQNIQYQNSISKNYLHPRIFLQIGAKSEKLGCKQTLKTD